MNKLDKQIRNKEILQDYLSGLNHTQLSKKYDLAKGSIHYILNKSDAKKACEATYYRRVEMLPLAIETERDLLLNGKEGTKLKVIQKMFDDTGIGRANTPYTLFQQVNINTLSPEVQRYIDHKASDLSDLSAIDAEYEEL